MVDFSNPNLCGASPEMNDLFTKLEQAADEIEAKLEEAASAAASACGSLEGELNALSDKLKSVEIPHQVVFVLICSAISGSGVATILILLGEQMYHARSI